MSAIPNYPIFVAPGNRRCLVVGCGKVGIRKLTGLLDAGASNIYAFDLRPLAKFAEAEKSLLRNPDVVFFDRPCTENDIIGSFMVFAATSDNSLNLRIAAICEENQILCNCATSPEAGNFILPAVARDRNLLVAISTAGASPLLAARWRAELDEWLPGKSRLAWFMGELRPHVLKLKDVNHREILSLILDSAVPALLTGGNIEKCLILLKEILPQVPSADLRKIFLDFQNVFP